MKILIIILTTADVLIALMLIALVLVQQSKEGGFGSAFGSMGESVFGAHAQSHLSKLTVIFSTLFLVITLILTVITGRSRGPKSVVEEVALDQKDKPVAEAGMAVPPGTEAPVLPTDVPGTVKVTPMPAETAPTTPDAPTPRPINPPPAPVPDAVPDPATPPVAPTTPPAPATPAAPSAPAPETPVLPKGV